MLFVVSADAIANVEIGLQSGHWSFEERSCDNSEKAHLLLSDQILNFSGPIKRLSIRRFLTVFKSPDVGTIYPLDTITARR